MQPAVLTHDPRGPAFSYMDPALPERDQHPLNTIVIVEWRLIEYLLHDRRKNCILAGLAYIPYESVVPGLAHLEDIALDLYRPPVTVLIYEPE